MGRGLIEAVALMRFWAYQGWTVPALVHTSLKPLGSRHCCRPDRYGYFFGLQ